MKVTIGIPTYNRKKLLAIMASSLYKSELGDLVNIRVYDDCSSDYNKDFLHQLFPTATSIKINSNNLKSDKNIYQMYVDFLNTNDDYFFNADSDIIFNIDWLNKGLELLKRTDGILSLFNANSHEAYRTIDNHLMLKWSIGSAGTLFSRERIIEIVNQFDTIEKVNSFDWQWCNYFKTQDVKIYCVNKSLVQHIGYHGQNSNLYFDIGRNYKIESIEDGQIMNDILEKSIDNIRINEKKRKYDFEIANAELSNDFRYHLKKSITIFIKKIVPKGIFLYLKTKFKNK